jgi:3-oxoacyl-[acyl-carrier protein] reductase
VAVEEWDRIVAINLRSVFLMSRQCLPHMRTNGWGRIVNMSSVAAKVGIPHEAAYSATKAAVVGFTRSLAMDVGQWGVTANALCPGHIVTGRTYESAKLKGNTEVDKELVQRAAANPVKRAGNPDDIAGLVGYLCSDAAGFVNGQAIDVDGGLFSRATTVFTPRPAMAATADLGARS